MTDILKVTSQRVRDPFEDAGNAKMLALPEAERELQRDGYGRPLLIPAGGRTRVPYSRMSSLADYLMDQRGVHIWEDRYLAQAIARNPDIAALIAAQNYNTGFNQPEPRDKKAAGREIDAQIARALDRLVIHELADYGTAFHKLTEPGDEGVAFDDPLAMMCESFEKATRGIDIVDTEMFTANDLLMAAGTFDHLVRVPGFKGLCILDKKTGELHPEEFAVQFAGYANADIYDPATDRRMTFEEKYGEPVNLDWAFVAWTPSREVKGTKAKPGAPARTIIQPINIAKGYVAAQVAVWVRDYQRGGDLMASPLDVNQLARDRATQLIDGASTKAELVGIYQDFEDVWTDELTARGGRRMTAGEIAA